MSKREDCDTFQAKYTALIDTDRKTVSRIANKLLSDTFIIKEKQTDREDYYFCAENRSLFESLFSLLDYSFSVLPDNGLVYIETTANRNRVRLSKFDTALLLVLRKSYNQKRREISSTDQIYVSVDDLISEMETAQAVKETKQISKYNDSLRKLRTHKIIDFTATRISENTQIQIFPSIQIVIPQEKLEDIIQRLNALNRDTENNGEDSEDENTDQD